jgi:hypothetical protein
MDVTNKTQVQQRINDLITALHYDTEMEEHFTIWERMQINQERASLMAIDHQISNNLETEALKKVSIRVEEKIQLILSNIQQMNWESINKIEINDPIIVKHK